VNVGYYRKSAPPRGRDTSLWRSKFNHNLGYYLLPVI